MARFINLLFCVLFIFCLNASQDAEELPELPTSFQSFFSMIMSYESSPDDKGEPAFSLFTGLVLYDDHLKTFSVYMEDLAELNQFIFNYSSNQQITIKDNDCTVEKLEKKVLLLPFPHESQAGSKNILLFDGSQKNVDKLTWKSTRKLSTPDGDLNCTITHVFDELHEVKKKGFLKTMKIICGKDVDIEVDFLHFRDIITDPEKLQQPAGVYCESKESSVPFPTLPDRFRLMREAVTSVDGQQGSISFQEVWYDREAKLILIDEQVELFHTREVTIRDFKRGLTYVINRQLRKCELKNLTESEKMASKESVIMGIDSTGKAQYVGKRLIDGVLCNVWAVKNKAEVVDVAFIQVASISPQKIDVPIKVETFVYSENKLLAYLPAKIFHFESYPGDRSLLDTTNCFDEGDQGIRFRLTIEGSDVIAVNRIPLFEEAIYLELMNTLQVTPSRISNFQVHHMPTDDTQAFVYAAVTENPASYGFGKDLKERNAEDSYQHLLNNVAAKNFVIDVPGNEKLRFTGSRVERLSKNVKVNAKPVEPSFPPSFQTNFILNFVSNIYRGTYLYDNERKTAAIHFNAETEKSFYIYNFESKEELIIVGHKCKAKQMESGTMSIFPFASKSLQHDTDGGVKSILLFDGDNKVFLNEEENSLKQRYQKWGSNKDIVIDGQKFTCFLTHWFRLDDLEMTTLEVIDVQCMYPDKKDNAIEFMFQFTQFNSDIKDSEGFQQPMGVFCDQKASKQQPPQLPNRFYIAGENLVMAGTEKIVSSSSEVWYDADSKLMRSEEKFSMNDLHAITVADYKTGVRYYINVLLHTCAVHSLTEDQSELISKEELLGLRQEHSKSQFVGQRTFDGIAHNVWSYASENFTSVVDIAYIQEVLSVTDVFYAPVKVDEYIYQTKLPQHTSKRIFKYEVNPDDWSIFDLTSCFNSSQQIPLHLTIEGSGKTETPLKEVSQKIHTDLTDIMKISSTRISRFQMTQLKENSFLVSGILTGSPALFGAGNDKNDPTAEEAFNSLLSSFKKGIKFEIKGITYTTKNLENQASGESYTFISDTDKYTSGSMAALGICMLALGGVLGAAILTFYIKYKQRRSGGLINANAEL